MADLATVARPYAEALVQSASPSQLSSWSERLFELSQMAAHPEVASLSNNPNVSQAQLAGLLLSGMKNKADDVITNFVNLIISNHRLAVMPEIAIQFEQLKNELEGSAEVFITSAFPMSDVEIADLLQTLKKRFGDKKFNPSVSIDPDLIGGVKVIVGDEVLDTSVKSRLASMQAALSA